MHRTTEIISERIQLGPRSAGGSQFGGGAPAERPEESKEEPLPEINLDEGEIKPEEIPF
jgi:hypothetical protein